MLGWHRLAPLPPAAIPAPFMNMRRVSPLGSFIDPRITHLFLRVERAMVSGLESTGRRPASRRRFSTEQLRPQATKKTTRVRIRSDTDLVRKSRNREPLGDYIEALKALAGKLL